MIQHSPYKSSTGNDTLGNTTMKALHTAVILYFVAFNTTSNCDAVNRVVADSNARFQALLTINLPTKHTSHILRIGKNK